AEINEKLQEPQDNPALLDELSPMLEQASKSYQLCKERIAAAQNFIDEFEKK
ncbi:exodeoxyribonuclease VII small subunit, partial [Francisella tularensis]|uniref:exodeoxyribonuclease VII small subunit n=1 Tax=Francisella tularensis TaxID=263 RepID=UPI003C6D8F3E